MFYLSYYDDETEIRELTPLRAIKDNNLKTVILVDAWGDTVTRDGIRELGVADRCRHQSAVTFVCIPTIVYCDCLYY